MSVTTHNNPDYHPHPFSGLVRIADVATALWRQKVLVCLVTVLCAVVPYGASYLVPNYYFVYTQILLDPDGTRVFTSDLRRLGQQRSADLEVLSQQSVITSDLVLGQVVEKEELRDDPDFGAASPHYPDEARRSVLAIEKLRDAVKLKRIGDSYVIEVKITDIKPERAMRIARQIPDIYFQTRRDSTAEAFRQTGRSLSGQLDTLKSAVEAADRAVTDYRGKHNIALINGQSDIAGQVTELNNQISDLAARIAQQKTLVAELNRMRKDPAYRPSVPDSTLSRAIVQLRARFDESREELNVLASSVGTRHPSYQSAERRSRAVASTLDGELRNHTDAAARNLATLEEQARLLAAQQDRLKAQLNDNDATMVTLRELERKLASERMVYEEFLLRTQQLSQQAGTVQEQPRVINPASTPLRKAGPPRSTIAFIGGLTGLLLVMAVVLLRADLLGLSARRGLAA